jgi:succinate dehydrogenase hydrophobic anchor subunit
MENTTITLSGDSVKIQGKYYTVSNGFLSKQDGTVTIPYKDLLSADYVKRRSKRIMYIVLLLGSLLILVLSGVRTNIGRKIDSLQFSSLQSAYKTAQDVSGKIRDSSGDFYNTLKAIVTGIMILTAIVCVFCIIYLFSGRRFIEITFMRGTYRVVVQRGDRELPRIVSQLQARIARR